MTGSHSGSGCSLDTAAEAGRLQIDAWRAMSLEDKAALVAGLCRSTRALALAGVRRRHPDASERECFLRLAALTLGTDLACRVYPELAAILDRP